MTQTGQFPTLDRANELMSEIIDEIPSAFFDDLHGGILLSPDKKMHRDSQVNRPLYIMGEYVRDVLGNQIKIYYGSFECIYPNTTETKLRELLKKTLLHEFTHHLEYKAGLKDLEVKDAEDLKRYRSKKR
ncbi:MAG TPA: hypothetical protein DCS67_00190 [Clostridiales bacterium UBA8960]|jgi:predicted Zn-dependent protease with MMP-like domain|nr:hypothetical protein [Clostridiales bacterium UBA8960]